MISNGVCNPSNLAAVGQTQLQMATVGVVNNTMSSSNASTNCTTSNNTTGVSQVDENLSSHENMLLRQN